MYFPVMPILFHVNNAFIGYVSIMECPTVFLSVISLQLMTAILFQVLGKCSQVLEDISEQSERE